MLPNPATSNHPDRLRAHVKKWGDSFVGHSFGSEAANILYGLRVQFCAAVLFYQSGMYRMTNVFRMGYILKIAGAIVSLVTVDVINFVVGWNLADECGRDEAMHGKATPAVPVCDPDFLIPTTMSIGFNKLSSEGGARGSGMTYPAFAAHLVGVKVFNSSPRLSGQVGRKVADFGLVSSAVIRQPTSSAHSLKAVALAGVLRKVTNRLRAVALMASFFGYNVVSHGVNLPSRFALWLGSFSVPALFEPFCIIARK